MFLQGHWKCHHAIERTYDFLLTFYSNYIYGFIWCYFCDIQCRIMSYDLEIRVKVHSRSLKVPLNLSNGTTLKVVPLDRLSMVSYYCSVVTLSLKPGAPAGFQARVGKIRRQAPKKNFSFAHPGFQFAHPAIRNGCPPCPPYRGGFKGKGLVGH